MIMCWLRIVLNYKVSPLKSIFFRNNSWFFILLSLLLFQCAKDPSDLGLNLQPQDDRINGLTIDSSTIFAFTKREDSLSTDERSYALLGSYVDPVFGRSDAGFLTQIRLSSSNVSFGSNPFGDSIVIFLDYRSYYGDTTTQQNISVYEIANDLYTDSTYYSNLNINNFTPTSVLTNPLSYYPRPNDTVLRIKLNDELAQRIATTDPTNLASPTAFSLWFKGLYVKTDAVSSNGAIIYFDLLSSRSKVTLYYHNDASDSLKFDFIFNSSCARVNLFNHDYSSATITSVNDSVNHDSLLYLQAMSGLMAKIKFPHVSNFKDSVNLAIVKAELIIPVDNSDLTISTFKQPSKLLLVAYNSEGKYEFVPDYFVGDAYFGGYYNESDKTYRFNISRYIQQLVDKTRTDYGLALIVADNRVSANRIIIKNQSPTHTNGMKLSITYLKP